jgi:hypothetical protein
MKWPRVEKEKTRTHKQRQETTQDNLCEIDSNKKLILDNDNSIHLFVCLRACSRVQKLIIKYDNNDNKNVSITLNPWVLQPLLLILLLQTSYPEFLFLLLKLEDYLASSTFQACRC